ncbi:hypothetical protein [Neisseria sicca]
MISTVVGKDGDMDKSGAVGISSYSGLTLNQYGVASPCRTICTVCGFVALS